MIIFEKFLVFIQGLTNFDFVIYFGVYFVLLGLIFLFMRLAARW